MSPGVHHKPVERPLGLLLLPGELRNRVYGFCSEPKFRAVPRKPRRNVDYARLPGQYGSLQYVCRQIHTEFSPIYRARTVMQLHQPAVDWYIRTMYSQNSAIGKRLGSVRAVSGVDCASLDGHDEQGNLHIMLYHGVLMDFTLLLQFCTRYPTIKITFHEASASLRLTPDLHGLISAISTGLLQPDWANTIQSIWVCCSRSPVIKVQLHQNPTNRGLGTREKDEDARAWFMGMGAPEMRQFGISVIDGKTTSSVEPLELQG